MPRLRPFAPIFDQRIRRGAMPIGNTPPGSEPEPPPPYDTLLLSLGPTRYYPGGQLLGPDLVPYDSLLSAFGPSIWVADGPITDTGPLPSYDELLADLAPDIWIADGPITDTGPLDSYDEVVLDLGPTRYYPGDEVNP